MRHKGFGLLLATFLAAWPAAADTPPEEVKELAARAEVDYKLAHFEEALDEYSRAYAQYPSPGFLFNIGQCHKMLKNHERAVFFFEGYLRDRPNAPNRAMVEELIEESRRAQANQKPEARPEPPPEEPPRVPPPVVATPERPPTPPNDNSGRNTLRIAGIATAAVGLVLTGAGVYFGLRSQSARDDVEQLAARRGNWDDAAQETYDRGRSSATAATVLFISGGAALATGGVLSYLGWRRPANAAVVASPQGASATMSWRF
jgi:tetratricopeptide (TPR) repeat protein